MPKKLKVESNTSRKSALSALAAANDLALSEADRQLREYADKKAALRRSIGLRKPTSAEITQYDRWGDAMLALTARQREIILLEFATMDSSVEVAAMIGKVSAINASLEAEKAQFKAIEERVQNVARLISHMDAILKNLLTIATLFA